MKSLKSYIQEKLVIGGSNYKYFPKSKEELKSIIDKRIKEEGNEVDLNDIDVSKITDMSNLFYDYEKFNGDISGWDVSNVKNMSEMFFNCNKFNQDISKWNVSSVTDMYRMFYWCVDFNQDISKWDVSKVTDMDDMFSNCPIKENYKPVFKI